MNYESLSDLQSEGVEDIDENDDLLALDLSKHFLTDEVKEKACLEDWLSSYSREKNCFNDLLDETNNRLEEAFSSSEQLVIPNSFRTSVCWELFDRLTNQFSRYNEILNLLKYELLAGTYVNDGKFQSMINEGNISSENLFELKSYYNEVQRLHIEKQRLKTETAMWRKKLEKLRTVLQKRQAKLRKAAMKWFNSIVYKCFSIWKERVSEKRVYRQKVMAVFGRWKWKTGSRIFEAWKKYTEERKSLRLEKELAIVREEYQPLAEELTELQRQQHELEDKIDKEKKHVETATISLRKLQEKVSSVKNEVMLRRHSELKCMSKDWKELSYKMIKSTLHILKVSLLSLVCVPDCSIFKNNDDNDKIILELPVDQLILRWVNHILQPLPIGRVMKNFTNNLKDSEILYRVIYELSKEKYPHLNENLQNVDWDLRAREVIDLMNFLKIPPIITIESIINGDGDLNLCFLSYLLLHFTNFDLHDEYKGCLLRLEELNEEYNDIQNTWSEIPDSADTKPLYDFIDKYSDFCDYTLDIIEKHENYTNLWNHIKYRICSLSWDLLLSRGRNKSFELVDWDLSMLKILFVSFDSESVKAINSNENDAGTVAINISNILEEYYEKIKYCYFFYNSLESNDNKMSSSDFLLFVRDTGIISDSITIQRIRQLFEKPLIPGGEIEENDIDPPKFVRRLCHLSYLQSRSKKSLTESLKELLENYVIKNTGINRSYEFRKNLSKPSVRTIINSNEKRLRIIYRERIKNNQDRDSNFDSIRRFSDLMGFWGFYDNYFCKEDVTKISEKIWGINECTLIGGKQLSFMEFWQGLCAVALYKNPDPYMNFEEKISSFIRNLFMLEHQKRQKF